MEPHIVALLSPTVLTDVAARYATDPAALTRLGSFESVVYATEDRVFRFTHSSHRTARQVNAELEWLAFLAEHGLSVAKPLPSASHRILEEVPVADGSFIVATFEHAGGVRITAETLTDDILVSWGRFLGKLHVLSASYRPRDPEGRPTWYGDEYVAVRAGTPASIEPSILETLDTTVAALRAVPTTSENFGLVHNDPHNGNFHWENGRLTFFDFDDSCYNFYVNDLAMALYYGMWMAGDDKVSFGHRFLTRLLEGYRSERTIGPDELRLIPDLMRIRDCSLYVYIQRKLGPEPEDDGLRAILTGVREALLAGRSPVDLDFESY
ncbi:phosphotransferase enzyme family protein [Deinococcus yavapaiensis]|nr:phosphotransferase [Deinococcus yavapaiensis]